jgi:MoxR-like ATPase
MATRDPSRYSDDLAQWISVGASPRASIALDRSARAYAWLQGRDYVSPEDVRAVAEDVLGHRIIVSYTAQAEGVTTRKIVREIIRQVAVA